MPKVPKGQGLGRLVRWEYLPFTVTDTDGNSVSLNLSRLDAENIIESLEDSLGRRQDSILALTREELYQ